MLGSWPRTLAASLLIAAIVVVGVWAYVTGALTNLRYASFPGHPYPPTGYYQNPFNPKDRGDLINATDAARVKSDLLRDGDIELKAVATGDASLVPEADTGNSLVQLQKVIANNNAAGLVAQQETSREAVVVGRLLDPNTGAVTWCVEEKGTATITYLSKSSGQPTRRSTFRFDDKFWLVLSGDRYLITDAEIRNQPTGGS